MTVTALPREWHDKFSVSTLTAAGLTVDNWLGGLPGQFDDQVLNTAQTAFENMPDYKRLCYADGVWRRHRSEYNSTLDQLMRLPENQRGVIAGLIVEMFYAAQRLTLQEAALDARRADARREIDDEYYGD